MSRFGFARFLRLIREIKASKNNNNDADDNQATTASHQYGNRCDLLHVREEGGRRVVACCYIHENVYFDAELFLIPLHGFLQPFFNRNAA